MKKLYFEWHKRFTKNVRIICKQDEDLLCTWQGDHYNYQLQLQEKNSKFIYDFNKYEALCYRLNLLSLKEIKEKI